MPKSCSALFKQKSNAIRSNNRDQTKQIQQLIDAETTKAKGENVSPHVKQHEKSLAWYKEHDWSGKAQRRSELNLQDQSLNWHTKEGSSYQGKIKCLKSSTNTDSPA